MIKIYDIDDKLLMQAEVTSAAKREQEISKSDYISLSFSAAEKVILPVGAYINYTYKIDKVREVTRKFLLLESYEPIQTDECSWKYTPQFQHPKMILSKTPFFIYTRNSQNVEIKQNVWSFVGTTSVLSGKIADFLNKDLMFGECGWKVFFQNVTTNTVNVSFSDNDFISALTAITNAIGDNCEWHIDYDDEIIYIGKVLVGATPVVLEVGKNVGVPSINNSKEVYYNAFSIFGGTRNITQVNSKGENVSSGDIRLQLDEGNGTISIDGKERSYSIDKYSTLDLRADKTKEPLFTKVLDFSQIFPSLNTYVYNVRGRVKYVLDENNNKIPISNADGSIKEYKTFTVWYMRLAYPTTEKVEGKTIINTTIDDGITHYWYDFEVTDNLLIYGKNIGCSFEANFNTGALSTPLAGRGTNGDYVGFELTYHKEASSSHTSDDVSKDNFSVLAGDYEIIYQEDNEVIIPTNEAEMLIPCGESKPSLKCNITVLYNIAMADTIYYEDAQDRLLEKAKEEIVRLLSDLNNYEVKSYSDVFLMDNPQLQIGQSVTYKDGHGYELATRVLKLSTNIDYDFIQSITIGNQAIKGTITQLKEDVQTIIASGGSNGSGGGYSVSQLRSLIAKYGSDNFISKQFNDTAHGTITFEKVQKFLQGLAIGESGKHYIDKNGGASLSDVVVDRIHDAASTPSDRVIIGAQGFDLYMGDDGKSHMYLDNIVVRQKFFASSAEIRKISYSGGTTIFSNAGSTLAKVSVIFDADGNCIGYKCYACADDGTTRTMNWWRIGMMALCQTFNVKAGKNEKLQNRYYWRLVVGVGQEILDDGKLYDYVVLSNKEKFLGSESIVPTYANKLVTADGTNMLVFGDYGIEVSAAESMGSMAGILMKLEDKETDEGGNLIANRYFYGYESGIAQDAPAEGDVIVQVGDQICWKSRGNLIKISTSTEDNATDNAPAITMYHNLGALYSTGKKDSAGMEIISPYQWKTCTCVISPEQVKFNANNFMWFTEDPEKPFSPITVFYNIETNGMFRVGSSGRLYGDNVENGTAKVSVCCYKVMGDTKDVLDECWWESSCQDIKIDSPYTGRTDLQTNDAAAQNLPAYFTLDCYTLSVTADGTKHRGDVLLATMDIPVLKDGDKGEKGDKGDKGEQGEQGLRGLQGETGEQGIPGTPGKDGKTTYFHIKYSSEANPTTAAQMTETPNTYIGTYVDFLPNDSTDPNVYTWSRFEGLQGKDGTNGIPGKNGADGRTSYLHIKYSNDGGQTLTVNDGETPGSWIGQYTDYEQKDSTNVTKYTWSKIKGEQGDKGDDAVSYTVTLTRGSNGITQGLYVGVTRYIGTACTTGTIIDFGMSCKAYTDGTLAEGLTDRLQTSDNYIDFAAFPKAKSFTVELFDKNGNKVATGNYSSGDDAISILVEDAPLVFDTDDSGTVPASVTKTAKVKVMKGNTNVADDCTQLSSRDDLSSNCMCNVGKDEDNGCISVSVQGNWISKNDVIVDGVNQGKVSATSGYAVAQFVYAGVVYFAQVPFSVNVAKFTGSVVANNKKFETKFTEISNRFEKTPTNDDLTKAEARITQTAREISLSVSEKSVGRRNLLVGSAFLREDNHYMLLSDTRVEMNTGYQGTNCIRISDDTTDGITRYPGAFWDGSQGGKSVRITKGKKYVISCWYKTNNANGHLSLEALYTDKQTNAERKGPPKYLSAGSLVPKPNQWQLFTTVIDTTDAEYDYIAFNFYEYCGVESGLIEAYICRPMVEEGDTYGGWTLSQNDYDIIGANLIDNSRTLDVGGNVLKVKGQKALVGDAYELTYIGSDDYNTFYQIKGSTFKLGVDYTISFEVRGDAKYMGVYAYYPITNTKFTLYAEPQNGAMTEVTDGGKVDNYVTLIQVEELSKQQRVWSHFRFEDRLPEHIYFQFPKNSEQTGVTSWSVTITKPKIEVGAVVTEYTERKSDLIDKASLKAAGIVVDSESVTLYGNQVHIKKNKTDANDTVLIDNETGQVSAGLINAYEVVAKGIKTQELEAQNLNVTGNSRLGIFEIKTSSIDERDQYSIAGDMITYRGSYKLPDGKTDIISVDGLAYLMYKPLFIRQGAPENGRYMRLGNNYTEWDDCGTGNGDSYLFNGASARYVCSGSSNCTYYALPKNLTYNTGYSPVSYIYTTKATQNDPAFAINVVKTKDSSDGTRTAIQTNGAIRGVIAPNLRIMNYSGQISSSDCIVIATTNNIKLILPPGPVAGQTLLIFTRGTSNIEVDYNSTSGEKMYSSGEQTKIKIGGSGVLTYFIFDGKYWCYAYFNGSHRNA